MDAAEQSPNERLRIAVVGCGSRWGWQLANGGSYGVGPDFAKFADYVAVCDADSNRVQAAQELVKNWNRKRPDVASDYRKLIDRDDIDAIVVFTPDHWHTKVAVEAMRSGKDVYCEKPLTLTIDEGRLLCDVTTKTGRILQVGTQQRSLRSFQLAVALVRAGRLGDVRKITCGVGGAPTSPSIPVAEVPATLDWNQWLGPAPMTDYRYAPGADNETKSWSRCHYEFRWWYEYSGGKLTDWGAHHVDIATWVLGKEMTGPVRVEPLEIEHPVEFKDGQPIVSDRYNTASRFEIRVTYDDGKVLMIDSDERNGLLIEGDQGRIFVNRGTLAGVPVDELESNPISEAVLAEVNRDLLKSGGDGNSGSLAHVRNFFECLRDRGKPTSDVWAHHRALSTCHLAAIAARLNRTLLYDPNEQRIVDDQLAQTMLGREKRNGFEIE